MSNIKGRRPIPEQVDKYCRICTILMKIVKEIHEMMPLCEDDIYWWIKFYMPELCKQFQDGEAIIEAYDNFTKE